MCRCTFYLLVLNFGLVDSQNEQMPTPHVEPSTDRVVLRNLEDLIAKPLLPPLIVETTLGPPEYTPGCAYLVGCKDNIVHFHDFTLSGDECCQMDFTTPFKENCRTKVFGKCKIFPYRTCDGYVLCEDANAGTIGPCPFVIIGDTDDVLQANISILQDRKKRELESLSLFKLEDQGREKRHAELSDVNPVEKILDELAENNKKCKNFVEPAVPWDFQEEPFIPLCKKIVSDTPIIFNYTKYTRIQACCQNYTCELEKPVIRRHPCCSIIKIETVQVTITPRKFQYCLPNEEGVPWKRCPRCECIDLPNTWLGLASHGHHGAACGLNNCNNPSQCAKDCCRLNYLRAKGLCNVTDWCLGYDIHGSFNPLIRIIDDGEDCLGHTQPQTASHSGCCIRF